MENHEIGKKRRLELLGPSAGKVLKDLKDIAPEFEKLVHEMIYAEFHTRPHLSDKHRLLAVVACLIGQDHTGLPLELNLRGMLNVGYTKKEVVEALLFLAPYVGFPTVLEALRTAKIVFQEER